MATLYLQGDRAKVERPVYPLHSESVWVCIEQPRVQPPQHLVLKRHETTFIWRHFQRSRSPTLRSSFWDVQYTVIRHTIIRHTINIRHTIIRHTVISPRLTLVSRPLKRFCYLSHRWWACGNGPEFTECSEKASPEAQQCRLLFINLEHSMRFFCLVIMIAIAQNIIACGWGITQHKLWATNKRNNNCACANHSPRDQVDVT